MDKICALKRMTLFILFVTIFLACSKDEIHRATTPENLKIATIYYQRGNDKGAIIYTSYGKKKFFRNGKKFLTTDEIAPDPIEEATDTIAADTIKVIEDTEWDDETAITETTPDTGSDTDSTNTGGDTDINMGALKAFPGAEGFGRFATGGRGGKVVEVTNLNDSGSGSLREALKMTGTRTIVFKVAGTINCSSYLSIPSGSGNVTIAGQTAPGEGITVKGAEFRVQESNVIIRHMRFRLGDNGGSDSNRDGIKIIAWGGKTVENIVIDHCSISWADDENIDISAADNGYVKNVTIQNNIISENIGTHYGMLLWKDTKNITIYKNLFAHNSARNIRSSTCLSTFEMINNVVYGFSSATSPTYENQFDVIGNVYKSNPNTSLKYQTIRLEASTNNCPDGQIRLTEAYISDNSLDNSKITVSSDLTSYTVNSPVLNSGISPMPNSEVEPEVLNNAGASLFRDAVDKRIVSEVINRTGGIKSSPGTYPSLATGKAYTDSDKDGISDEWEKNNGLNPNDASDGNKDRDGDGYTNLEEFLYSLES